MTVLVDGRDERSERSSRRGAAAPACLEELRDRRRLEVFRGVAERHDALLEPDMLAVEHLPREVVLAGVVVAPHLAEELVDTTARAAGEEIRQAHGARRVGLAGLSHPAGAGHG